MLYFRFINRMANRPGVVQRRSWLHRGAVVPYCLPHLARRGRLRFVARSLFDRYQRAPRQLSVLYWRMHPGQHPWLQST